MGARRSRIDGRLMEHLIVDAETTRCGAFRLGYSQPNVGPEGPRIEVRAPVTEWVVVRGWAFVVQQSFSEFPQRSFLLYTA
jgi:hypothetical protein